MNIALFRRIEAFIESVREQNSVLNIFVETALNDLDDLMEELRFYYNTDNSVEEIAESNQIA